MPNPAPSAIDLQEVRRARFYSPAAAAEGGLCPLAWYIKEIEHSMDNWMIYNLVDVFEEAGIQSISVDVLKNYQEARNYLSEAMESTLGLLQKLEALQAQRKRQQQFAESAKSKP